jgi:hypothetical protein
LQGAFAPVNPLERRIGGYQQAVHKALQTVDRTLAGLLKTPGIDWSPANNNLAC